MLEIILGRALSGKTTEVIKRIGKGLNRGRKAIYIVPDQATFNAEMLLCQQLNLDGFIDVQVLTWNRFCDLLLKEAGLRSLEHLDDRGRCMLLQSALLSLQDQLSVFGAVSRKKGFVQKLSRMIALLKSCNITPEALLEHANKQGEGLLKQKLLDTQMLYAKYEELLEQGYQDNYDSFFKAAQVLPFSKCLRGTDIYIDGFEVLTAQMMNLISVLLYHADVTLALAVESQAKDRELYALQNRTLDSVIKLAQEQNIPIRTTTLQAQSDRFAPEILHLKNNLYAYPASQFTGNCENIHIYNAKNYEAEVIHCAAVIYQKVRYEGFRYRDFCVCSNNLPAYSSLIGRIFKTYDIPVFTDKKRPLLSHPLIGFLMTALLTAVEGFTQENLINYVNNPFTPADREEADAFLNLCTLLGIKSWELDKGYIRRGSPQQQEELLTLRDKLLGPLIRFKEQLSSAKNAKDYTYVLYQFIQDMDLEGKLNEHLARLEEENLQEQADEHRQVWNLMVEMLQQLENLLQSTPMTPEQYARIVEEGFEASEVSILPTSVDCVFLGDMAKSKYAECKITFALGMNYGVVPAPLGDEAILSDRETELLNGQGLGLSPDAESLQLQQQYDIYSALIRPYGQLYLSYAAMDDEGNAMAPSILISRIKSIFPRLRTEGGVTGEEETIKELLLTAKSALLPFAKALGACQTGESLNQRFISYYSYLARLQKARPVINRLKAAMNLDREKNLPPKLAKELFFSGESVSISRLEQFASCPFSHFVEYGLRPEKNKEFEPDSIDLGSLFHQVLERFLKTVLEGGVLDSINKEQAFALAEGFFAEAVQNHRYGVLNATARSQSFNRQLKVIASTAAYETLRQIQGGRFRPLGAEIEFGSGKGLPPIEVATPLGTLKLKGIIDRCDVFEKDGKRYLRVIDYKSGNIRFDADKLADGTQVQLPLYLKTLCDAFGEDAVPSGAFYFHIAEIEQGGSILLDGPVLNDEAVLLAMDEELISKEKSDIVNVKYNKKTGELKSANLYTEAQLRQILDFAQKKAEGLARQMLQGEIEPLPINYKKNEHPCTYCQLQNLCMRNVRPNKDRRAKTYKKATEGGEDNA